MKNILLIGTMSLIISCTGADSLAMRQLYSIESKYHEDIRGNFITNEFILFKDISMVGKNIVTITEIEKENQDSNYIFGLHWDGMGWRFYESLLIKTDKKLYELKDINPTRNVITGNRVSEILRFGVSDELLTDLRDTESMSIQYYLEPINITPEGMTALKTFLK